MYLLLQSLPSYVASVGCLDGVCNAFMERKQKAHPKHYSQEETQAAATKDKMQEFTVANDVHLVDELKVRMKIMEKLMEKFDEKLKRKIETRTRSRRAGVRTRN